MEAAGHAVAKTAGVGEPCTMIEAATYAMAEAAAESGNTRTMREAGHTTVEVSGAGDTSSMIAANSHAMTQAVAEFAVATIVGSVGAVG